MYKDQLKGVRLNVNPTERVLRVIEGLRGYKVLSNHHFLHYQPLLFLHLLLDSGQGQLYDQGGAQLGVELPLDVRSPVGGAWFDRLHLCIDPLHSTSTPQSSYR